ncbi:MAG: AmpG family muropeptide MFS transporter [Kangiellaceae bacterium]
MSSARFATVSQLIQPATISMLFLGMSSGIPLLLIFSSLSLWLSEAGVARATVTYFSWAALGYSFKFLWAPLIDRLPIPFFTSLLGRRRGWMLLTQLCVITAILLMGSIDPSLGENSLTMMALAVVLLGFTSATQDAIIDAYRIEVVKVDIQALMAASYIAGYRSGMILSGAGALFLAQTFGSTSESYNYSAWQSTYYIMASIMLIGVFTTLLVKEPVVDKAVNTKYESIQYVRFLLLFILAISLFVFTYNYLGITVAEVKTLLTAKLDNQNLVSLMVEFLRLLISVMSAYLGLFLFSKTRWYEKQLIEESLFSPVADFFKRYGFKLALLILLFVGLYRISDIVLGVIALVFYQDMGFSKVEIAAASKSFGLVMTILGGFLGGVLSVKYGVMKILVVGAVSTIITNLFFVILAHAGRDLTLLYLVISADNITGGLASTAFIAYLASLTNVSFTAVQYALFSSLMTLIPKAVGGYSGTMVDAVGYENFFLIASAMGLPVLVIIYFVNQATSTYK